MKIIVPAYSKTYWCLKPFAYLFNKYWENQTPVVLHYGNFDIDLPNNFSKYEIYYKDYPMEMWADGIIKYLKSIKDETIVLLLEDYWLVRQVSNEMVLILNALAERNKDILRIDLTTDRLYAGGMRDVGQVGYIDLIEAPGSMYQMSLQAGIWRRDNFLEVLELLNDRERSSWGVELTGTGIVNNDLNYRVFGTRQFPLRYENGVNVKDGVNKTLFLMNEQDKNHIMKWIEDK